MTIIYAVSYLVRKKWVLNLWQNIAHNIIIKLTFSPHKNIFYFSVLIENWEF